MNTNKMRFTELYVGFLRDRFENDAEYAYSAARTSPEALAEKMVNGLIFGNANKDGDAIKSTCKALKIKHTYKAIKAFLGG